ncbi:TraB/GumN family protein [Alteromonas lipotrueiana]|uniref:TraB/GumN family protein n=1 Tax=Alteromonas lipotrueiana TaxID=2803815 RepID=UPI001C45C6CC|nr:TraB/GumN family protein [Alteromonas lipotrueiana]
MRKLITSLAIILLSCQAQGAAVWQVSNGEHTLYLGGTLHILSPQDYPLPSPYETAFAQSDTLVFETDMETVSSASFAAKMIKQNSYENAETVAKDLNPETYQLLESYMSKHNLPINTLKHLKPAMLGLTLTMLEYQRAGLTSQGVDAYFFNKAMDKNKPIEWFETPDQQLSFISAMADGQENEFIRYTLEDIEDLASIITPMKTHWRSGDMQALHDTAMGDVAQQYPQVYDDLLVKRNQNWLPKIEAMMQTPEVEFVLVGTLHMPGSQGVLALLKQKGYTLTQLN